VQEQSDDEELQGDSDAQPSSALGEGFDDLAALLDDESEPVQDGHLAVAAESAHEPAGASVDAAGAGTHEAEEAADAVHEDDDGIAPLPSTPTMKKPDRSKRRYSVALKRDAELEDFLQEIEQEEEEEAEGDTGSVRVSVPSGLSAGEVLYVGTPDGREIVVEVPAGCGAGDDIVVDVGEGAMTVEAWEAQMAAAQESTEESLASVGDEPEGDVAAVASADVGDDASELDVADEEPAAELEPDEAEETADAVHEDDDGIAPLPSTPTMKKPDRSKRRYSVALKRDAELEDFLQEIEQEEDLEEAEGDTGSVRVSVPPGLSSGEVLYVGTPDGREIVVEVPAGCGAGDDIVVDVGEGAMTVEAWEAQMAAAEESAEQTILTESEADLEVQIGEALYLVDLASDLVFQIHPVEKEVGLWDAESRRIVFDEPV